MAIPVAPLRALVEDERFRDMDKREAYWRATQDQSKRYDWDGNLDSMSGIPIAAGYRVPDKLRRPSTRYDLAKLIVGRLTSMVFGQDRFPELRIEGDTEAEDYVQALALAARLPVRMQEARNLGGATGTAVMSFGFREGKPRIRVHNAKHCQVLAWRDFDERRPLEVLKAYSSPRQVYDPQTRAMVRRDFWTVYYWNEQVETIWRDVPQNVGEQPTWSQWPPASMTIHGFGFCPVYWIQNRPCSELPDGEGDYEGQEGTFDQVNQLLSATTKGTRANVDPTLVIKMDPAANTGAVQKGTGNAIFSPGGAEYLELKGTAVQAAERQLERLRSYCLDVAGVVMADPEKLAGAAQSAKALEILYQPMLSTCDVLREQYGEHGIRPMLIDMLLVARVFETSPPITLGDGTVVQSKVILPPKVETSVDEAGNEVVTTTERTPGTSDNLSLNWRPYFAATWDDIVKASTGLKNANGGKATMSQRTSVAAIAPLVGIKNVDAEMAKIEEEEEAAAEKQVDMFAQQSKVQSDFAKPPPGGED